MRTEATSGTVVFALHLAALLQKKELAKKDYDVMGKNSKKAIQSQVMKTTKEAYLTCLFILMEDDERYGGVKTVLGDNYLLGKQEYPQNLLAAKRLLADFKGARNASSINNMNQSYLNDFQLCPDFLHLGA